MYENESNHEQESDESFENSADNSELAHLIEKIDTEGTQQINEYFDKRPELRSITDAVMEEIESAKTAPISASTARNVETAIFHLINEALRENATQSNEQDTGKSFVDYSSLIEKNPNDPNILRLQITELKRKLSQTQTEAASVRASVDSEKKEKEKLFQENQKLLKEKNEMSLSNQKQVQELKLHIQDLEEQITSAADQDRRGGETVSSLKKRLRDADINAEADKREIDELKQMLQRKTKAIQTLKEKLKMGDIKYEELKVEKTESEMNLSSMFISQSRIHDQKTKSAVTKLIKFVKQQNQQMEVLIRANRRAARVIEKLSKLTEDYEDRLQCAEQDVHELKEQVVERHQDTHVAEEKTDELSKILEARTEELTELREIVAQCVDSAAPKFIVTPEELPELVKDLAMIKADKETADNLVKLNALVDGLTRFSTNMVNNNYAEIKFLKEPAEPVVSDGSLKLDMLNQIEKVREYLETICYSSAEEDPMMSYLAGIKDGDVLSKVTELSPAIVFASICYRMQQKMQADLDELVKVKSVLPFTCTDAELPEAISKYLLDLQPVFNQLLDVLERTLKYHGTTEDIFQCLCKYVEETSQMINELDQDVRPLIGFSGKIVDMPKLLVEALTSMKSELDNYRVGVSKDLDEMTLKNEKERAEYKRQINDLNEQAAKNQGIIDTLQARLDETAAQLHDTRVSCTDIGGKKSDQEREIQQLKDNNEALEAEKQMLLDEKERLENLLKTKQEQNDKNLEEAVQRERQIGEEELERHDKKYQDEIQILSIQINKLSKKLNAQRKKSQEKTVLYNELSKQTTEEIKRLNAEKQELTEQIGGVNKMSRKVTKLEKKLQKEKETNQLITEELSRLSITDSASEVSTREVSFSDESPSKVQLSPPRSPRQHSRSMTTEGISTPRSRIELDSFIKQIGAELDKFIGKEIQWNKARIVDTITAVIARINELEFVVKNKSSTSQRATQLQKDWATWADSLLADYSRTYRKGMSELEMREKLSDIVRATNKKLASMVENLRIQKELMKYELPEKSEEPATLKDLITASRFIALCAKCCEKSSDQKTVVAKQNQGESKTLLSFV